MMRRTSPPPDRYTPGELGRVWLAARAAILTIAFATTTATAVAQTPPQAGSLPSLPMRSFENRAELEAAVRLAEAQHRTQEAWMLRTRLEKGDFQEGDRLVLALQYQTNARADTLIVRAGKTLQIPGIEDLSLEGVLRSELTPKLLAHLGRFLVNPTVRATPLIRIAVLGKVGRPNFYYTSADVVLSDLIMQAGGPAADADLNRIEIRRGGQVIWNATDSRTALSEGLSIDRLHLRANDEVEIGEKKKRSLTAIWPIVTTSLALVVTVIQLTRSR
jgi:protein involved in polysaccharide export with SLBB domain